MKYLYEDFMAISFAWGFSLSKNFNGARGRNRTGTNYYVREILSLLCLPIPPPGLVFNMQVNLARSVALRFCLNQNK